VKAIPLPSSEYWQARNASAIQNLNILNTLFQSAQPYAHILAIVGIVIIAIAIALKLLQISRGVRLKEAIADL
jgi:hypothetical protein